VVEIILVPLTDLQTRRAGLSASAELLVDIYLYHYTARWLHVAAAQCIVIGPVCGFVTAGGLARSEPYYSQRARSVCVSLSVFFSLFYVFIWLRFVNLY